MHKQASKQASKQGERGLRIFLFLVLGLGILVFDCFSQNEERLTLTTYYPAPYGTYQQLVATDKFLVCDTADVATNLGDMSDTSPDAVFMGNVGIGTTDPQWGRLMIEHDSVPLSFRETDMAVDDGGLWRMPLEGGNLRFDVNTGSPGSEFGLNYRTPLFLSKDGEVGIGTANPGFTLDVNNGNIGILNAGSSGNRDSFYLTTHPGEGRSLAVHHAGIGNIMEAYNYSGTWGSGSWNSVFTIHQNGDVGIVGRSIGEGLHLSGADGDGDASIQLTSNGRTPYIDFVNDTGSDFDMRLILTGDDILQIDGGALNTKLKLPGNTIQFTNFYNSGGAGMPYLEMNVDGTTAFGISLWLSSRRYKENIRDLSVDSEKIYDLRPVNFDWKDPLRGSGFGLIAEEVYETLPDLVAFDDEGIPHHVDYGLLSVLLLNEVKKLKAEKKTEIESLKQRMDALEFKFQGHNI